MPLLLVKKTVSSEAVHFEVNSASVYPVFLKSRSANSGSVIFESVNCETVSVEATSTGPKDIKDCLGPVPSEPGVILSETVYVKPVDQRDCFSSAHSVQRICRTGTGLSEPAPVSLCSSSWDGYGSASPCTCLCFSGGEG